MHKKPAQKGFTIVETLVAITVLMIAIAGPLSIASKSLTAAVTSRDQFVASYLAQESLEVVKNIRDNDLATGSSWLASPSAINLNTCIASNPCDASSIDSPTILNGQTSAYRLYQASNGYSHTTGSASTISPFSREFYLTQVTANEYAVTVSVAWNEGSIPYSIIVSNTIINNPR